MTTVERRLEKETAKRVRDSDTIGRVQGTGAC